MSFNPTPMRRALDRERVLEFEEEVQTLLYRLTTVQRDVESVNAHRQQWLENISQTHCTGTGVYEEKLSLLQAQAELSRLNLKLDSLRLDAHHEIQTLCMLVEATKPLAEAESEEQREEQMRQLSRENAQRLLDAMQASLGHRVDIAHFMHDCELSVHALRAQTESEQRVQEDEWRQNIQTFQNNMVEAMRSTKTSYQTIVREYLVLRHNAQVAKTLLTRSQHDSSAARLELQRCLEQIEAEAARHRAQSESTAQAQWFVRTRELRAQVVEKEKLLDETTERVTRIRQHKSLDAAALQREVQRYEALCRKRERQRETDLQATTHELRYLRESIRGVEERLSALHAPPSLAALSPEAQREFAKRMHKRFLALMKEVEKMER